MGGKSRTASTTQTVQDIDTTSVGLQDTEGLAIGAGGDVEFTQNITDAGAVQGAFEFGERGFQFAEEFVSEAFDFAGGIAAQAGETSQAAVATVATGGASDLAGINQRTILIIAAAAAAIFILPQVFRRAA